MTERNLDTTLRTSLINNDPYKYFHLVKFEKPSSGVALTRSYSYLTDASFNITFDDGFGSKSYIANKLLSIGTINETIEAKASNLSITLASEAIGSIVSTTLSAAGSNYITGDVDFSLYGFRQGDKVLITGTGGPIEGTISTFQDDNTTLIFQETGFGSLSGTVVVTLTTEEILALHGNLNYANREVSIYKGHMDPSDGSIIGTPFLAFKGIINSGRLSEDLEKSSTITWNLTSHWGDFVRVQGRITSDAAHRALDASGTPDTQALVNQDYATDTGFEHSEKAVNLIAVYNRQETRYRQGGWALNPSIKAYTVNVPTELDLNFNLNAKYLPIVYGVRKVDSIPIFVDLDNTNPNEVYVVYAICEGEIAGIYDVYFQDQPLVCLDSSDESVRGKINNPADNVDVVCYGRADRGDVIAGNYKFNSSAYFITPIVGSTTKEVYYGGEADYYLTNSYVTLEDPNTGEILKEYLYSNGTFFVGYGSIAAATAAANADIASGNYNIEKFQQDSLAVEFIASNWSITGTLTYSPYTTSVVAETFASEAEAIGALEAINNPTASTHGLVHNGYIQLNVPLGTNLITHTGKSRQAVDRTLFAKAYAQEFKMQNKFYEGNISEYWDANHKLLDTAYVVAKYTIAEGDTTIPSLDFVVKGKLIECFNYDGSYAPHDIANNDSDSNFLLGDTVDIIEIVDDGAGNLSETGGYTSATIIDKFYIHLNDNILETRYRFDIDVSVYDLFRMKNPGHTVQYTFASYKYRPDLRVSTNPAIQLLDYLTNVRYGKGLKLINPDTEAEEDINITSFKQAAVQCDERSDVTIALTTAATPGETLTYGSPGEGYFQGTVVSSTQRNSDLYETVLTDCIGKLGNKWNDFTAGWTKFVVGDIIWYKGNARQVTNVITSPPIYVNAVEVTDYIPFLTDTLTSFQNTSYSNAITSFTITGSTSGSLTVNCDPAKGTASGNPVVRSWDSATSDYTQSGYSLYDSDDVKYWKYVGWDRPEQRWVTRHQMNQIIRTDTPIFTNVNAMLEQFNGILRYSNGLYELVIKSKADTSPTSVHYITKDDIIGSIKLSDNAGKDLNNSISANIVDPQNKFESRAVSFFNSTYLKEDRNIPKQGNIQLTGITNYYNARFNCKQKLDDSRFKRSIVFDMAPKGYLLQAGSVINVTYDRFSWTDKQFRINSINLKKDGIVQIAADEHNDEIYVIPNLATDSAPFNYNNYPTKPSPITGLTVSTTQYANVTVNITHATTYDPNIHSLEIYAGPDSGDVTTSSLLATTKASSITIPIDSSSGDITQYYWARYVMVGSATNSSYGKLIYSDFYPDPTGVTGTALSLQNALSGQISNESHTLDADFNGFNYDLTGSGGSFSLFLGVNNITTDPGVTYSVVGGTPSGSDSVKTQNGLTMSINTDTGVYTLSGASPSWTTSVETFTLRATYLGVDVDKVYSISKSLAAAPLLLGTLTVANFLTPADNDGTNYSLTSGFGSFKVYDNGVDVTNSATFSIVGGTDMGSTWTKTQNGLTLTIFETGTFAGDYGLSGATPNWTSQTEFFIMQADYDGRSVQREFTATKVLEGQVGADGAAGPGLLYRGDWAAGIAYYRTSTRADVVKGTDGNYYIAKSNHTSTAGDAPITGGSYTTYWDSFSAVFDSVATDLLLAQDVTILKTLTMGESGGTSGIIKSWNYSAGTTGWSINGDTGVAEFNSITARGTIQAGASSGQHVVLSDSTGESYWYDTDGTTLLLSIGLINTGADDYIIVSDATGTGAVGSIFAESSNSSYSTIYAENTGGNSGLYGAATTTSYVLPGVRATNASTGSAIYGTSQGYGIVGRTFATSSTYPAIFAEAYAGGYGIGAYSTTVGAKINGQDYDLILGDSGTYGSGLIVFSRIYDTTDTLPTTALNGTIAMINNSGVHYLVQYKTDGTNGWYYIHAPTSAIPATFVT